MYVEKPKKNRRQITPPSPRSPTRLLRCNFFFFFNLVVFLLLFAIAVRAR